MLHPFSLQSSISLSSSFQASFYSSIIYQTYPLAFLLDFVSVLVGLLAYFSISNVFLIFYLTTHSPIIYCSRKVLDVFTASNSSCNCSTFFINFFLYRSYQLLGKIVSPTYSIFCKFISLLLSIIDLFISYNLILENLSSLISNTLIKSLRSRVHIMFDRVTCHLIVTLILNSFN